MNNIIAVNPVENVFSITWMIGRRCNYDCMYCPAELHDTTSRPHDLDTMKKVWQNIYEKTKNQSLPYKISFTGGEPTANKNFLSLVEWLRSEYPEIAMILITTNGSASTQYYLKLSQVVEAISFSTHSEFMDEYKFFDLTDQDQVADQDGADNAGALILIKRNPDGDDDASKGLFIIAESELDAYAQQ
jgi:MoaA/NifB/PqqE/SkfB family radical SAM enzyme